MCQQRKIVLFGAGKYGSEALIKIGENSVLCFCDNNPKMVGKKVKGKIVISPDQLTGLNEDYDIVISINKTHRDAIYKQLCSLGLEDRILDYTFGIAHCKGIYSVVEQAKKKGLIIYGTGFWGEIAYRIFKLFNLKPIYFCEDDINETFFCETKVISLKDAVQKYPNAVFIAAADDTPIIGLRTRHNNKLRAEKVYSEYSAIKLENYIFLLDTGIDIFENYDEITINDTQNRFETENLNKIIVFNHTARSGSYDFESLLDNHRNILTIPLGMGINNLIEHYLYRLKHLSDKELIVELCALLNAHFHTNLDINRLNSSSKIYLTDLCRTRTGEYQIKVAINPFVFAKNLCYEFNQESYTSFSNILKVLFSAYNNTLEKKYNPNEEYWIYFHIHQVNVDLNILDSVIKKSEFKRIEYLFLIREPVQRLYCSINTYSNINSATSAMISSWDNFKTLISNNLGYVLEKGIHNLKKNVMVVRFEDLKLRPKETMLEFCKWAEIDYIESLTETTINGIKIYFAIINKNGDRVYITGNDPLEAEQRDFSSIMTSYDILRLNIAFQKLKKAYGYELDVPEFNEFSKEFLKELYLSDFKFTKTLINNAEKAGHPASSKDLLRDGVKELFMTFIENYQDDTEYYQYFKV